MNGEVENRNPGVHDGPCRETAASRLERIIASKRRELTALEGLHKIAKQAENGSPLEELLWGMVGASNRNYLS